MSRSTLRAVVLCAGLLLCCFAVPASAATNLLTNGGFETAGTSQTVFSDSLPDLAAWQTISGSFTLAAGVATSSGAGSTRDLAVVRNSQDYTDGTVQAVVNQQVSQPQLLSGVVARYQGANDHYLCGIRKNDLVLVRRQAGTDTELGTTGFTSNAGTPYLLRLAAAGTSLTCTAQAAAGGTTASVVRTDSAFASGSIGFESVSANPSQVRKAGFSQPAMTAAVPAAWSTIGVTAGRPGLVPDKIPPANGGSAYLQLFSGAATFAGNSGQTVAVTGGTSHTLQAAIRTDAVVGSAQVIAIESPSNVTTVLATVTGTTAWTVYSTTFTTQPGTTQITVRPRITGSGRASFDDVSLFVSPLISMSLSAASVDFGAVDPISAPAVLTPALSATVVANTNWQLTVAGSGNFADGTGATFPLANLGWRISGSGAAYTPFSTTATTVATGTATAGTATPMDFRLNVTYQDPVSALPFQTSLTYIAASP